MSNFDIAKNIYATGAPALMAALSPDVDWTETAGFPYGGRYRGVEQVIANVFARIGADWDGFRADAANIYDAGETVIATGFYRATSKATNRQVEAAFAHVLTFHEGKIVRFEQIADSKTFRDAMA